MDQEKIKQGVRLILEGVGEDLNREGLVETPDRVARMYEELLAGLTMDGSEHLQKTFSVENNEMVLEKDITFYCLCAGRKSGWLKQTGKDGGDFCEKTAIAGTDDRTDCRCTDGLSETEGCYGYGRSRTYVYDHAWNQETGQQDGDRCKTGNLSGGERTQ